MGEAEEKVPEAGSGGSGNVEDVPHEINPILTGLESTQFFSPAQFKSPATRWWGLDCGPEMPVIASGHAAEYIPREHPGREEPAIAGRVQDRDAALPLARYMLPQV